MTVRLLYGDCRAVLPTIESDSVQCCVTSPPYYGLRDYGVAGQIGLEQTPDAYVAEMVAVFREVRRVLRDDGVLWLNLGDSYASKPPGNKTVGVSAKSGLNGVNNVSGKYRQTLASGHATKRDTSRFEGIKEKDLLGIPWMVAFALRADGWYLRSDIIWAKPNPMPESVRDRPTSAHEHVFLLSKSARYFYDADAIREPMAAASIDRLAQDIDGQAGSARANGGGKTNGPMKAVAKGNAKTFRGGGAYTEGRSFDNSAAIARDSTGNTPNLTGDRNARNVWTIATQPFSGAHFATMPPELAERCIKAGSRPGDTILDPFGGAGTTGLVADRLGRNALLIELNADYGVLATERIRGDAPLLGAI